MARDSSTSHGSVGARAVGGAAHRRRPAWLLPLLALLALLLLIGLLIALLGGDDDNGNAGNRQSNPAALTVGGQPLSPTGIKQQIGQDASGKNVVVQQVIADEGFTVGTSKQDAIYIEYGGAAGKTEGGYHPKQAGERVTLDGPVRPAPADPAETLRLPAAEAARVEQQGAYINANSVQRAGQ